MKQTRPCGGGGQHHMHPPCAADGWCHMHVYHVVHPRDLTVSRGYTPELAVGSVHCCGSRGAVASTHCDQCWLRCAARVGQSIALGGWVVPLCLVVSVKSSRRPPSTAAVSHRIRTPPFRL
jgi:hypothetical protein